LTQAQIGSTVGDTQLTWRCPDNTITVFGDQWNSLLNLVLAALSEDQSPLANSLYRYLKAVEAPDPLKDVEVSADVVRLIRSIAPKTTLTPVELDHVQAECDGLLNA